MFTIFTDTDTDLTLKEANEYGYKLISMPYVLDEKELLPRADIFVFSTKSDYKKFNLWQQNHL